MRASEPGQLIEGFSIPMIFIANGNEKVRVLPKSFRRLFRRQYRNSVDRRSPKLWIVIGDGKRPDAHAVQGGQRAAAHIAGTENYALPAPLRQQVIELGFLTLFYT